MERCRGSSNNQTLALGRVAVASFANVQGLTELGNNDYQANFASGSPVMGQAGAGGNGTITGGAVEESNVNLSTEFANMIVAQQSTRPTPRCSPPWIRSLRPPSSSFNNGILTRIS